MRLDVTEKINRQIESKNKKPSTKMYEPIIELFRYLLANIFILHIAY